MSEEVLSGEILGKISLMQSMVTHLPGKKSMLEFTLKGLRELPGVSEVHFFEEKKESEGKTREPERWNFFLHFKGNHFGMFHFHLIHPEKFTPYQPFIANFLNMLGVIFEEQNQRSLNQNLIRDLEDRVAQRTREIQEREELLRITLESIGDGVITTDLKGRIQTLNGVAETLSGFTAQEARGKYFTEVIHMENARDGTPIENPIQRVLNTGNMVGLANHTKLKSRKGDEYQISDSAAPIKNEKGIIFGVVFVFRDVTEDYLLRESLKKSEQQLTDIFDFAPVGLAVADMDENVLRINQRFFETFGYTLDEIKTVPHWSELVYPDPAYRTKVLSQWRKDIQKALNAGGKTPYREYEFFTKDGNKLLIEVSSKPGNGLLMVTFHDVTERTSNREKLRQGQKMRVIGQMAGGIAHDFNNMLTGIMGSTELLKQHLGKNSEYMEYINMILDASERAADLSRNLLTFSRRQRIQINKSSVHTILNNSVNLLKNTIDKKNRIILNLQAEEDTVLCDRTLLQTVFMNLAINASQAMPGGGNISFRTSNSRIEIESLDLTNTILIPGEYLKIQISDEGTGIPEESLSKIFEPFYTTKQVGQGTGLGLSAVYGIIQQHKGQIEVSSRLGEGTEFTILLPLLEVSGDLDKLDDSEDIPE